MKAEITVTCSFSLPSSLPPFFSYRGQSSIQDRMGLLQVAAINAAMSSLIKTITVR
jgi:hypothetical protein